MKIKSDFVTNSSSTAYVIYIPDNYTIESKKILKDCDKDYLQEFYDSYSDDVPTEEKNERIVKEIQEILKQLKNGSVFYLEDDQDAELMHITNDIIYGIIKDLTIKDIDIGGGGGQDLIIPITKTETDKIKNKFKK